METNIINRLGMTSTSFKLPSRQDIVAARSDMSLRLPDGSLICSPTRYFPDDSKDDFGGAGLFSCAQDYIKVLIDLLQDDSKLLSLTSKEELFKQQLSTESKAAMNHVLYGDYEGNTNGEVGMLFGGGLPTGTGVGYSVGGLVVDSANGAGPNRRGKGALSWSGLPNLHWMVDRERGVALFYGSQLLPPGDIKTAEAFAKFEEGIYKGELQREL
jgi:CubicO group peptidase (beta-lactamase class C family)